MKNTMSVRALVVAAFAVAGLAGPAALAVPGVVSVASAQTDPSGWGPGDLLKFPDGRFGTVDPNGRTITLEPHTGGASHANWAGVTVANAAAGGAKKVG